MPLVQGVGGQITYIIAPTGPDQTKTQDDKGAKYKVWKTDWRSKSKIALEIRNSVKIKKWRTKSK
jgi:hypothetical protein